MSEEQKTSPIQPGDLEAEWLRNMERDHAAFVAAMKRAAVQEGSMEYGKEPGTEVK